MAVKGELRWELRTADRAPQLAAVMIRPRTQGGSLFKRGHWGIWE